MINDAGWMEYKPKGSLKKEKATLKYANNPNDEESKKKKILAGKRQKPKRSGKGVLDLWQASHFQDECLLLRWRYYKILGHRTAECPVIPEAMKLQGNQSAKDSHQDQQIPQAFASSSGNSSCTQQVSNRHSMMDATAMGGVKSVAKVMNSKQDKTHQQKAKITSFG